MGSVLLLLNYCCAAPQHLNVTAAGLCEPDLARSQALYPVSTKVTDDVSAILAPVLFTQVSPDRTPAAVPLYGYPAAPAVQPSWAF